MVAAWGTAADSNIDSVGISWIDDERAEDRAGKSAAEQIFPVGSPIDRLQDAAIRPARSCVEDVRITWIQRETLAPDA